jgi:2,4-diaminopentanoate dehydrogenase
MRSDLAMSELNVIQIGLGPLGVKITRYIAEKQGIKVVGAVDLDPIKVGRDPGELCGLKKMGLTVSDSLAKVVRETKPDAVILTTVSGMREITPQILDIVSHGLPVVSTCEELFYPWKTAPELAGKIDEAAKHNRVAVLGTGVNPGFLMDALPSLLTGACQHVDKITVSRFQNAAFRRLPFIEKIGAGLDPGVFERKKQEGTLRHVGLTESIHFIAACLGWELSKTEDTISPVVTPIEIVTEDITIPGGHAAGVMQIGKGYVEGEERITLNFRAVVGEPDPRDTVEIFGVPNITSTIQGGLNGDVATCAIAINAVRNILKAKPGLRTMADVGIVSNIS